MVCGWYSWFSRSESQCLLYLYMAQPWALLLNTTVCKNVSIMDEFHVNTNEKCFHWHLARLITKLDPKIGVLFLMSYFCKELSQGPISHTFVSCYVIPCGSPVWTSVSKRVLINFTRLCSSLSSFPRIQYIVPFRPIYAPLLCLYDYIYSDWLPCIVPHSKCKMFCFYITKALTWKLIK